MRTMLLLALVLVCSGCTAYTVAPPPPAPKAAEQEVTGEPFLAPAGTVFVDEYDTEPKIVHQTPPKYPRGARGAGVQGEVALLVGVDASGNVIEATVARGVPALNGSALAAVRNWRFSPATRNGKPVAVRIPVPIRFTLTG